MRGLLTSLSIAGLCLLILGGLSQADAATVTIGPDLTAPLETSTFSCPIVGGCLYSQHSPSYTSPVTGAIVRWRVLRGYGPMALRVLNGNTAGATGAVVTPAAESLETFSTDLPIKVGERFGVELRLGVGGESRIGRTPPATSAVDFFAPSPASGEPASPSSYKEYELLLNVDIQPAPGITAITPASGPAAGGTTVVISGHDLTGATGVGFGSAPAASFSVDTETQITAHSPAVGAGGAAAVSVTTPAGSATSPTSFVYEAPVAVPVNPPPVNPAPVNPAPVNLAPVGPAPETPPSCVVPKLKRKKLQVSRLAVRAAGCTLGKITRRRRLATKGGRVVKQVPPAGSVVPAQTAVKIRLG
jgi:hypothetical protein